MLLDYARQHGIRHVQVSTDEVYGDVPLGAEPCTEDAPIRASSPYSASKAGGDLQVLAYVRTYGVDALITRGANTYGPRQYPEKFLPLFITNAFDGEQLPVYGDGKQRREWLHVGRPLRRRSSSRCSTARAGEVYNVGGQERENMEVVRRILDLTGASPDLVRHVDRPPRARPPLRRRLVEAARARLGARALVRRGRPRGDRRVVPRRTASGGSRSSRATTSGTTSSSTPASPGPPLAALLGLLAQLVDRLPASLDRLGTVEEREHVRALAERVARVGEVVVGVGLVESRRVPWSFATACSSSGSAPAKSPRLHLRVARVVQRCAARA